LALNSNPPELTLVTDLLVPPGSIVPGEKGGGQLPDFATASLQSLIPTDLTAVSVFNFVFASARTLTAEAVIFSEIQEIKNLTDSSTFGRELKKKKTRPKYPKKGKRSARLGFPTWPTVSRFKNRFFPSDRKSHGRKKPKPSRKKKKRQSLKSKLKSLIKNFQCLRTSLTAKSNPKIIEKLSKATQRPKKYSYGSDSDTEDFDENEDEDDDNEINSIDDCVEGVEEPLYGFRVKVKVIEDQPCILGKTCTGTLETYKKQEEVSSDVVATHSLNYPGFSERQTGENFASDAAPDCRIKFDATLSNC